MFLPYRPQAILLLTLAALTTTYAQQTPTGFTSVFCVDVAPGHHQEFIKLVTENDSPVAQARANRGELAGWMVTQSYFPGGKDADCPFHVVFMYENLRDPVLSSRQRDEEWAKVRPPLSRQEFVAKRDAISTLNSAEIWKGVARIGMPAKGQYMVLAYQRRNDLAKYNQQILDRFVPVHQAQLKENKKLKGWGVSSLYAPTGGGRYNTLQIHVYEDFPAIENPGVTSTQDLLKKMFGVQLADLWGPAEASKTEIRRVIDVVVPSKAVLSGAGGQ